MLVASNQLCSLIASRDPPTIDHVSVPYSQIRQKRIKEAGIDYEYAGLESLVQVRSPWAFGPSPPAKCSS